MEQNEIFHKRFKLKKLIGRGAFAEVWLAVDNYSNIEVALKIFVPKQDIGDYGARLLASEFAVVANLSHNNLLRPIYYDNCDGKPYLVLPYCEKGNCVKLIGKISEEEAWKLLRDVASGLAYLHSHKPAPIIHQDVKPDNILIGPDGQYMLSDFGVSDQTLLSAKKEDDAQSAMETGISSYKGPEYFSKDKLSLKASDIYSLGATLFELLTGDVPFGELGGLMQVHGYDVPNIPSHFSERLNYVVKSCLDKDTWQRPTAETLAMWAQSKGADTPIYEKGDENDVSITYEQQKVYDNHYEWEQREPRHKEKTKRRTGLWVTIIASVAVVLGVVILLLTLHNKQSIEEPLIANYPSVDTNDSNASQTENNKQTSHYKQKGNNTKEENKVEDLYESDSYKKFEELKRIEARKERARIKKANEKKKRDFIDNLEKKRDYEYNREGRSNITNNNEIIDLDKGEH